MSKAKKIWLTIGLSLLIAICVYGFIVCVINIVDTYNEYVGFLETHVPDFFWTKILHKNLIFLFIMLFVLIVNISVIAFNIYHYIKNKTFLWVKNVISKEEQRRIHQEIKKTKLEKKLKKIEKEIKKDA